MKDNQKQSSTTGYAQKAMILYQVFILKLEKIKMDILIVLERRYLTKIY